MKGRILLLCAVFAFTFGCAKKGSDNEHVTSSSQVQTIVLPSNEPALPNAPGRDDVFANCLTCHSGQYILMQPRFPRKVWKAEVAKMSAAFGAVIDPAAGDRIVDYLVAVNGVEDANAK